MTYIFIYVVSLVISCTGLMLDKGATMLSGVAAFIPVVNTILMLSSAGLIIDYLASIKIHEKEDDLPPLP